MKLLSLIIVVTAFFTACKGRGKETDKEVVTTAGRFTPGQVWKFNNRSGEDSATITILKVEKYEKGDTIIHIRIDGIKVYNPQAEKGYSEFLGHLPFSQKAIEKSVTALVRENADIPDFSDGYAQWRKAWDGGKGGYWTIDLKEAVEAIETGMRKSN